MSFPSEVARASVSRYAYPSLTACSNAVQEFSGACAAPPRCANACGRGVSRNGTGTIASMPAAPGMPGERRGVSARREQWLPGTSAGYQASRRRASAIATAAATATFSDPTRPDCGI